MGRAGAACCPAAGRAGVHVSVITHCRPASLSRLLRSLSSAHYLGDAVSLSFSIDAGADAQTLSLARTYPWAHGPRSATLRVRRGGLIAAVVESWFPEDERSYGLFLEDDIEVSPYFYVYLKLVLLGYVYATDALPTNLLGISLYTPRLVELRMPRRRIDVFKTIRSLQGAAPREARSITAAAVLVGLALLPEASPEFHSYMAQRLAEAALVRSRTRRPTAGRRAGRSS